MADLGANGFKQADFSSRGPTADGRVKPDISAPGVGISSAAAGTVNGYVTMNGTSMATPFVTGVALLMEDADPTFINDDIKEAIRSTAVDWGLGDRNTVPGSTGPDIDYGAGRLDAYAALAQADPNLTSGPQVPNHSLREGSLPGSGSSLEYTVDVATTSFPIAATMINVPSSCVTGGSHPDFDLTLIAPNGTTAAFASSSQRQDELGFTPTTTGGSGFSIWRVGDSTWGESTITWANQPLHDLTSSASVAGPLALGTPVSASITGLATGAQGGLLSIAMTTTGSQEALGSRLTGTPEKLTIVVSSP